MVTLDVIIHACIYHKRVDLWRVVALICCHQEHHHFEIMQQNHKEMNGISMKCPFKMDYSVGSLLKLPTTNRFFYSRGRLFRKFRGCHALELSTPEKLNT